MAAKIDTGSQASAHTAIQAMIGRAQITASRENIRVGVVCDLSNDELSIVDLSNGRPDNVECFRIILPTRRLRADLTCDLDGRVVLEEVQHR